MAPHGLIAARDTNAAPYEDLRKLFENALPHDAALYNEFHALVVPGEAFLPLSESAVQRVCAARLMPRHEQVKHNVQYEQCDQEQVANIG